MSKCMKATFERIKMTVIEFSSVFIHYGVVSMWPRLRTISLFHSEFDCCTGLYMLLVASYLLN